MNDIMTIVNKSVGLVTVGDFIQEEVPTVLCNHSLVHCQRDCNILTPMLLSLHRKLPTVPHGCFQCLIQSATLQRPNQATLLIALCEINYGQKRGIDVAILLHCLGEPTVFVSLMSPSRCYTEGRNANCWRNEIVALWAKSMLLQHTNLSLLLMTTMPVHNCISGRNLFCFAGQKNSQQRLSIEAQ